MRRLLLALLMFLGAISSLRADMVSLHRVELWTKFDPEGLATVGDLEGDEDSAERSYQSQKTALGQQYQKDHSIDYQGKLQKLQNDRDDRVNDDKRRVDNIVESAQFVNKKMGRIVYNLHNINSLDDGDGADGSMGYKVDDLLNSSSSDIPKARRDYINIRKEMLAKDGKEAAAMVALGIVTDGAGAAIDSMATRAAYEAEVKGLEDVGLAARGAGQDSEATARMLSQMRNDLKTKYRAMSPADSVLDMETRNIQKYGDPLGPSVDSLRAQGKSWDDIIRSSATPGGKDLGF